MRRSSLHKDLKEGDSGGGSSNRKTPAARTGFAAALQLERSPEKPGGPGLVPGLVRSLHSGPGLKWSHR